MHSARLAALARKVGVIETIVGLIALALAIRFKQGTGLTIALTTAAATAVAVSRAFFSNLKLGNELSAMRTALSHVDSATIGKLGDQQSKLDLIDQSATTLNLRLDIESEQNARFRAKIEMGLMALQESHTDFLARQTAIATSLDAFRTASGKGAQAQATELARLRDLYQAEVALRGDLATSLETFRKDWTAGVAAQAEEQSRLRDLYQTEVTLRGDLAASIDAFRAATTTAADGQATELARLRDLYQAEVTKSSELAASIDAFRAATTTAADGQATELARLRDLYQAEVALRADMAASLQAFRAETEKGAEAQTVELQNLRMLIHLEQDGLKEASEELARELKRLDLLLAEAAETNSSKIETLDQTLRSELAETGQNIEARIAEERDRWNGLNDNINQLLARIADLETAGLPLMRDTASSLDSLRSGLEIANRWVKQVDENMRAQIVAVQERERQERAYTQGKFDELTQKANQDQTRLRNSVLSLARNQPLPHDFYTAQVFSPEEELIELLAKHVTRKSAIDVGANRGDFSAVFARSGLSVDAFEPLPDRLEALRDRFGDNPSVHIHPYACSDFDGESVIHGASLQDSDTDPSLFSTLEKHPVFDGFTFDEATPVQVRTLDTVLAQDRDCEVGIMKVDAEGHDLKVLKGARRIRPEVIIIEFWNKDFVFNGGQTSNDIGFYLDHLSKADYPWHVVMWRGMHEHEFGFIEDAVETPHSSWGNVVFFRNASMKTMLKRWAKQAYGAKRFAARAI